MLDFENTPLQQIKGVGDSRARLFEKLGVATVGALLHFYPRDYFDWSVITPVSATVPGESFVIEAQVLTPVKSFQIRRKMELFKFAVGDATGAVEVTLFNNPYMAQNMKVGETFLFCGKMGGTILRREMAAPSYRTLKNLPGIEPVYPQTKGLTSAVISKTVRAALELCRESLSDPLSDEIRRRYQLCHYRFAVENIHFPGSGESLRVAKQRLVFDELLQLQLGLSLLKGHVKRATAAVMKTDYTGEIAALFPFELTDDQQAAIRDAVFDMGRRVPMNRLLQGDVGSGKTAVAASLLYHAARNGYQCAFMAPTEILARQHYQSLSELLAPTGVTIALLTGSTPAAQKRDVLKRLEDGKIHILAGTHALIGEHVDFQRLGLVVTDEQHRFGVEQRGCLLAKGNNPHTLVMSATPIPRTLALIIYGDLDISVIRSLPKGRSPIRTYHITSDIRSRAYGFIRKHIDAGRQAYIVCPLVEENETDKASAQAYFEHLQQEAFKGYSVGLLHGKMSAKEKDAVMSDFADNRISLLVSTTVIEVGIDVPNAVVMLVENADLFGLSQLHQLRGRVGRGKYASYCILVSDATGEKAKSRLSVLCGSTDGFVIAEEDLKLRGPGDFFGNRQHGLPQMKIADLYADRETLRQAQQCAKQLLRADPFLTLPENAHLKEQVTLMFDSLAL